MRRLKILSDFIRQVYCKLLQQKRVGLQVADKVIQNSVANEYDLFSIR